MEILALGLFSIVALIKVAAGSAPSSAVSPSISWFNPFAITDLTAFTAGILLAIFIYWGWDSAVSVNEETENGAEASGKAGLIATVVLVLTYVLVTVAVQSYGGLGNLVSANGDPSLDVFADISKSVLGSPLDKLLIIAVLTSASASTQTTILPATRSALSMARQKAIPDSFGHIHKRHLTPDVATLWMGAVSIIVFVGLQVGKADGSLIADAFTSLSVTIAFYYGITGIACTVFFRKHVFTSVKSFLYLGLLPSFGGLFLTYVFVRSLIDSLATDYGSTVLLGASTPFWITIGTSSLGIMLMIWQWSNNKAFFQRKLEIVDAKLGSEIAGG